MAIVSVNARDWNGASEQQQDRILHALRESGLLKAGDIIEPDPDAPPYLTDLNEDVQDLIAAIKRRFGKGGHTACEVGCDGLAVAAAMWCAANTQGPDQWACFSAVEAAKRVCYSLCK